MAEMNDLTIKKLDIAIKSFENQKKKRENLSKGTQNKLDKLILKYQKKKLQILKIYTRNKKHVNLIGIDKNMLSLNKLARLLGKSSGSEFDKKEFNSKRTKGLIVGGLGTISMSLILGEQLKKVDMSGFKDTAFAQFFTKSIPTWIAANPATFAGILVGTAAIATAAGFMIYAAKKKAKEQKMLMELEAEEKMNEGVKGRTISNFGVTNFSENKEALVNEVLDDPELEQFLETAFKSKSPAITPSMRANIATVLRKAEVKRRQAKAEVESYEMEANLIKNSTQADLEGYSEAEGRSKKLEELKKKKPEDITFKSEDKWLEDVKVKNALEAKKEYLDKAIDKTIKEGKTVDEILKESNILTISEFSPDSGDAEALKEKITTYIKEKYNNITEFNRELNEECTKLGISPDKIDEAITKCNVNKSKLMDNLVDIIYKAEISSYKSRIESMFEQKGGETVDKLFERVKEETGVSFEKTDGTRMTIEDYKQAVYKSEILKKITPEMIEKVIASREAGKAK